MRKSRNQSSDDMPTLRYKPKTFSGIYSEKLKDPRWQRKRLEILNRADFTCEDCCATDKELQVHHCQYIKDREPWQYNANVLMCLCMDCHKRRQETEHAAKRWFGALLRCTQFERLDDLVTEIAERTINTGLYDQSLPPGDKE